MRAPHAHSKFTGHSKGRAHTRPFLYPAALLNSGSIWMLLQWHELWLYRAFLKIKWLWYCSLSSKWCFFSLLLHILANRIKDSLCLLWDDYGLIVFLVEKQVTYITSYIYYFKFYWIWKLLPSQDFNVHRTCSEKLISNQFIRSFILLQENVTVISNMGLIEI